MSLTEEGKKLIREWETGGKRDTDEMKIDYEGFLHPAVLKRFAQYMNKNRVMRDGSIRESDNWQKGFGTYTEHMQTCMKSLWRHFHDVWSWQRDEDIDVDVDEALCGVMFNAMAMLHQLLEERKDFSMKGFIEDLNKINEEIKNGN